MKLINKIFLLIREKRKEHLKEKFGDEIKALADELAAENLKQAYYQGYGAARNTSAKLLKNMETNERAKSVKLAKDDIDKVLQRLREDEEKIYKKYNYLLFADLEDPDNNKPCGISKD